MTKGKKIRCENGKLLVPDNPIIPFIEGDGIGPDIWAAAVRVFNAAVTKAYKGNRELVWQEVLAGEKAFKKTGSWLPDETMQALRENLLGIKGPLTTPVGGGIRSLNVTLRQTLDLYVCLRPVCYFPGVPSPVKNPEKVKMVIFRENTEDVYAGKELQAGSPEVKKMLDFCQQEFNWKLKPDSGIGLKPTSESGSKRLVRAAIEYAINHKRRSVTLVHKGNIMKFTEGAFRSWGYEVARDEYAEKTVSWDDCNGNPPADKILIKDAIADMFLQQILTRPAEFDIIATMNLNGDYISDALAAQVGGIGIAPGGNINYTTGHAIFEATHGTAPKYANQDKVNPCSIILSGEMMLRYIGWEEAAELILQGLKQSLEKQQFTYDLARLTQGVAELKCSEFANQIIEKIKS